jgi:hypothetical protein
VLLLALAVWALFRKKKAAAVEEAFLSCLCRGLDESLERLIAGVLGEDSRDFYSIYHAVKRYLERRFDMPSSSGRR